MAKVNLFGVLRTGNTVALSVVEKALNKDLPTQVKTSLSLIQRNLQSNERELNKIREVLKSAK